MNKLPDPIYYGDYLDLGQLLSSQKLVSPKYGDEAHDETLFIIVHQAYELWFKQILHELSWIHRVFSDSTVPDDKLNSIVHKLERIKQIQSILIQQLDVMETMTPMDFLEFRDYLVPASGFQSVQFREIEVMMGLSTANRQNIDREYFLGRLSQNDRQKVLDLEEQESLLSLLEKWLERMPFSKDEDFDFWSEYKTAVLKMLDRDEKTVRDNSASLTPKNLEVQIENIEQTRKTFLSLFDEKSHQELITKGSRNLSQAATLNALFILLYRDQPILSLPFRILTSLMDIDENFTTWRYRHALMAQRMLGTKIGTGGSSGHRYLKMATEKNRVFVDLFNLSTFLIPRTEMPILPKGLLKKMNF